MTMRRSVSVKPYEAMIRRECRIITSNPRLLMILLIMPVLLILIFTFFFNDRLVKVPIGVSGFGTDADVIRLFTRLEASPYFRPILMERVDIDEGLVSGKVEAALALQAKPGKAPVGLLLDMSDPRRGHQILKYLNAILFDAGWLEDDTQLNFQTDYRYNPRLRSALSYMPGMGAVVIMMICVMMISNNLVEEKSKSLLVYITLSDGNRELMLMVKYLPYLAISCFHLLIIQTLNLYQYGENFSGGWLPLVFASGLYLINCFAIALCLGLYFDSLVTCFAFTFLCLVIPTMVFGGFMCPIENMPRPLQWIAQLIPAFWYYQSMLVVLYKGARPELLILPFTVLVTMTMLYLLMAYKGYKKQLL